jgi:hypothetical protein
MLIYWGENMHTRKKKNTEAVLMATEVICLETNTEQTKYRFMSRKQNIGQRRNRKISNKSIEKVAKLMYLGATPTNQNCMQNTIRGD